MSEVVSTSTPSIPLDQPAINPVSRNKPSRTSVSDYMFRKGNEEYYRNTVAKGLEHVQLAVSSKDKPFSGISPQALADLFRQVDLEQPLHSVNDALNELQALYLNDAVYFDQPRYMAHLNCPVVVPAVLAELVLSSINSSVDTWDQSAGATLIEQSLLDWTCKKIGFKKHHKSEETAEPDGIFTSGGTQSNLMALLLAREAYCKRALGHCVKTQGLPKAHQNLRVFCSEMSHFSVQKSAAILGLGYQSVVTVPVDNYFRMNADALENAVEDSIAKGERPFAVVATAGTTDFGSIDPLIRIAKLCAKHQIWFHVDAAYGCGLLVSPKHRHWLDGIELADSVTVDYHKSFFQPVSCGAFFSKNKQHLSAVTYHADYLNPLSQKTEGTPNLVDKSIQTTRRFDALKLWLTLRIIGERSIGEAFDRVIHLARQTHMLLLSEPSVDVVHRPQLSTVVFRIKPGLYEREEDIDELNREIRKGLSRSGEAIVAGTKIFGRQYLKFTLLNPSTTIQDVQTVVKLIKQQALNISNLRCTKGDAA